MLCIDWRIHECHHPVHTGSSISEKGGRKPLLRPQAAVQCWINELYDSAHSWSVLYPSGHTAPMHTGELQSSFVTESHRERLHEPAIVVFWFEEVTRIVESHLCRVSIDFHGAQWQLRSRQILTIIWE